MAKREATRGKCVYCGRDYTRWGMTRHLQSCAVRQAAIHAAGEGRGRQLPIFHLLVEDAWGGDFWLHLEIPGSTTLEELDNYLRAIWLECCGHLSAFTINGQRYTQIFEDSWGFEDERDMDIRVDKIFEPDLEFEYEYDFGTTSELKMKVVGERVGKWSGNPIALMARNEPLDMVCMICDLPATWLCVECMWGNEAGCTFCEEHLVNHRHGEEMALPVVNSPRVGMCGYIGPAEPPY